MFAIDLTKQLPWQKSVGTRPLHKIRYAVIHHSAVLAKMSVDPLKEYTSEANYHISKGWGHLSYHYKIDVNGVIYRCVPETEVGYHAGNWEKNLYGIGICLDGDFSKQEVPAMQMERLKDLMHDLAFNRPDLPLLVRGSFYSHKEVRLMPTYCPGPKVTEVVVKFMRGL